MTSELRKQVNSNYKIENDHRMVRVEGRFNAGIKQACDF